jgi:hypothetical protein
MLALLEFALRNLTQRIDNPLKYVLILLITVIVDKELKLMLGVLRNLIKDSQDKVFVMVVGIA